MVKEKSVKQLYKSVIIRNSIFFAFMTAFMIYVLWANLHAESDRLSGAGLILFFAVAGSFLSCYYEMRIVRKKGEFFMPTARFFMFLSKPVIFILGYVVMILAFNSAMENYLKFLLLCVYLVVATGLFYLFAVLTFRKKDDEVCYIDYTLKKLTKPKTRNSALIGVITASALLLGVIVWFVVVMVQKNYNVYTILGFFITATLLLACEFFYIHELLKKKFAARASASVEESGDDELSGGEITGGEQSLGEEIPQEIENKESENGTNER